MSTDALAFNPLLFEVQQDPYRYYTQLRDESPIYHIESLNAWGIFRYDDVAYTLKHPELFSARDFIHNAFGEFDPVPEIPSIISLDPPEHTRLRKLANKAFLPSVVRAMEPNIQKLIDGLLDEAVAQGKEFDFVSQYAAYVPVSVTAEILGVDPLLARGDFKRWTMDLLKAPSRSALSKEELASIRKSTQELRDYFREQITYRRKHPGHDLVSALVRAEEDDQMLTETEVLSLIAILQFGGAETPSHLITSTLYELFENPDTFDIDCKAANHHLAFAQGTHYCIGAGLGRLMCTMAVRTALERLPALRGSPEITRQGLFIRRSPFDKLRANGSGIGLVRFFPFVLSLSKHGCAHCRVIGQFPESL